MVVFFSNIIELIIDRIIRMSYSGGVCILRGKLLQWGIIALFGFLILVMGKSVEAAGADEARVAADYESLTIGFARFEDANGVARNISLPIFGSNGSSITWNSSNTNVVGNTGTVTRPGYLSGDANVTMTATISYGSASMTKTFSLKVLKQPGLNWTITGQGEKVIVESSATGSTVFRYFYQDDEVYNGQTWGYYTTASVEKTLNFTWHYWGLHAWFRTEAQADAVVIHLDNTVTRVSLFANQTVGGGFDRSGTASVSLQPGDRYGFEIYGKNYDSNNFLFGQLEITPDSSSTDQLAVELDSAALGIGYMQGDSASHVTGNLVLPSSGTNGTSISWVSHNESVITNVGAVSRPAYASGDAVVSLTATITKGGHSTQKVFPLTVIRLAPSSDANLTSLTLSDGVVLSPVFSSGTLSYTANVASSMDSIKITPTLSSAVASVKVNNTLVASGTASVSIPLNVGQNTILVEVTAQNGASQTYTVQVTRAQSSDANLIGLSLSGGATLVPTFSPNIESYTVNVANNVESITVKPTLSSSAATVKVNDIAVLSGTSSGVINLDVHENAITIVVKAQDGTEKTYTVTVTRAQSSDANLIGLSLSSGATLNPSFSSDTEGYTANVAHSVESIIVTPTLSSTVATMKVNETVMTSGASKVVYLNVGENTVRVEVTAQNGSTKIYTVVVSRAGSNEANLTGLTLTGGAVLTPGFSPNMLNYMASVTNSVYSITVTPTLSSSVATVRVNDNYVTSGTVSQVVYLNVGVNPIIIEVTAQDGSQNIYTVYVTRGVGLTTLLGEITFVDMDLREGHIQGTVKWSRAVDETHVQSYVVNYMDENGQKLLDPLGIVPKGTGLYSLTIPTLALPSNAVSVVVSVYYDNHPELSTASIIPLIDVTSSSQRDELIKSRVFPNEPQIQINQITSLFKGKSSVQLAEYDLTGDGRFGQDDLRMLLSLIDPVSINSILVLN